MSDTQCLPEDNESLRAMVIALQAQSATAEKALKRERAKVSALDQHIATLEQQLAALRRARYGRSSEQLDENIYQLELMLEDLGASVSEQREEPPVVDTALSDNEAPTKKARTPLPSHLPRETRTHEVEGCCEVCGDVLSAFSEDTSEQLEYIPASFQVIKHVRPKYRCGCDEKIHQTDAPSRPIPRSYAGPGLLSHVAIAKFLDHQPLYRQSAIYSREGVELSRTGSDRSVAC